MKEARDIIDEVMIQYNIERVGISFVTERILSALTDAGLVIVPIEPTEAMILDGAKAMDGFQAGNGNIVITGQPKNIYRAMITASTGDDNAA